MGSSGNKARLCKRHTILKWAFWRGQKNTCKVLMYSKNTFCMQATVFIRETARALARKRKGRKSIKTVENSKKKTQLQALREEKEAQEMRCLAGMNANKHTHGMLWDQVENTPHAFLSKSHIFLEKADCHQTPPAALLKSTLSTLLRVGPASYLPHF